MMKPPNDAGYPGQRLSKQSSLIAKCTAPFASKQRTLVEHEIRLDQPFRSYSTSERVRGAVYLNLLKPIRITHLVIRLHGFVKVINRTKLPGETISYDETVLTLAKGRGRRGIEYFGNGFARLFEDEVLLCGEGRVVGPYKFDFDIALPSRHTPSSIDFEHGTISYLLTSTMTRSPTITAMASASSCHQKLNVLELIDIAQVPKPKPESVSMDVAYRNGMSKIETRRTSESSQRGTSSNATDVESVSGNHHQALNLQSADEPPHSPAPSEISSASANTSNTSSNPTRSMTPPLTSVVGNLEQAFQTTLSAQTELLQGGCLAGDALPLRISIRHNTAVKRMQGIVITLYRQGRIDTHPAIPLGPFQKGKKAKYEDYYPKSHTGLGGLSLSSAGSSRSFRQDLNQIFAPIIVDPLSLTAIVNTSIQAPVDLFPTISGVPGAMISFKYYVEVVIDLRGKFGSQDRIRPHLSMTSGLLQGYGDPKISKVEGPGGVSYSSTPGFNFLVTDQLRRTKGVVFTRTEVIVGTLDSSRKRRKQEEDQSTVGENKSWRGSEILSIEQNRQDLEFCQTRHEDNLEVEDEGQQTVDTLGHREVFNIPPPEAEEILDEKLRLQRAEARLLPSAPPQDDGPTSSNAPLPTAPEAFDEEDFIRRYGHEAAAPAYIGVQDDKQELERQRLLRLANSPDEHEDGTEQDPPDQSPLSVQPTAPALYEDDIFDISDPRVPQFPAEHSQENNTSVGPVISNGILHHDNDIYEEGPSRSNEPNKDNLPVYRR